MDMEEESDSTLSDVSDETIYVVLDDLDEESLPMQDIPQNGTLSTATSESNNSSSNNPPLLAPATEPLHMGNYEVLTDSSSPPEPPILISLYSEILRSRAPTSDEPQNPPSYVLPLTSYPDYEPPPFRRPILSILSSNTTNNNPSETSAPSEQTTNTLIQTLSEISNKPIQTGKKRGRERLRDKASGINNANVISNIISIPKKCGRKRKEGSNNCVDEKANNASSHENSASGKTSVAKKQSMEMLRSNRKNRTAFPKGTFLIRYSDLETLDCNQIWCVDNHYMLVKYLLSSHIEENHRLYLKSQPEQYVCWRCEEPWHFYELTVIERNRDGSRVFILYPDPEELAECRDRANRQKQEMKQGLNCDGTAENTMVQKDNTSMDTEEQHLREQQNIETEMANEAVNVMERFILIGNDHSTETDE